VSGEHGRPSNERDGACICDYNPSTTDGPQEDCPFHGRPYAYWIERGDALAERLAAIEALLTTGPKWHSKGVHVIAANKIREALTSSPAQERRDD
jgi:hypothetical protein